MKKLSKIITIIVIIILISVSIWVFFKNKHSNNELANNYVESEPPGIGGTDDDFYGWREQLDVKTFQLIETIFDESYKFVYNENGEYIISLEEIKEKYYIGFEYLNTDTIKCNLKTSYFKAYVDEGEHLRSINLECKNSDE